MPARSCLREGSDSQFRGRVSGRRPESRILDAMERLAGCRSAAFSKIGGQSPLMSWSRAFHVPITTPDGLMLRTLRDAGEYIQALPRAKYKQPEWQIAAETLLAAVEGSGPLMFAEIAMRKAVNAGKPAPEPTSPRRAAKK
jgi:hypothetical protein